MINYKLSLGKVGIILIGILVLFSGINIHADENWRIYGITKYFIFFYDSNSIIYPSNNIIKLWIKSISKCNDIKDWAIKDHPNCANVEWVYVLTLTEIDCSRKQDRDIKSVGYSKEGDTLEYSPEGSSQWMDIIPESYTEILYKIFCP